MCAGPAQWEENYVLDRNSKDPWLSIDEQDADEEQEPGGSNDDQQNDSVAQLGGSDSPGPDLNSWLTPPQPQRTQSMRTTDMTPPPFVLPVDDSDAASSPSTSTPLRPQSGTIASNTATDSPSTPLPSTPLPSSTTVQSPSTPLLPSTPSSSTPSQTPINSNNTTTPSMIPKSPARRPGSAVRKLDQTTSLKATSPLMQLSSSASASDSQPTNPVARHDVSVLAQVAPPPLKILSWNVQNFTADARLGTYRGALESVGNRLRIGIIAKTIKQADADVLLLMETGKDVSTALAEVGKLLPQPYDLFVTEETHATPQLKDSDTILPGAITARHVDALRNISEAYTVTVNAAPASEEAAKKEAWEVWRTIRASITEPPPLLQMNETVRDQIKKAVLPFAQSQIPEARDFAEELKVNADAYAPHTLALLRDDRSYAIAAFSDQDKTQVEALVAWMELLEVLLLIDSLISTKKLDVDGVPLAERRPMSCAALVARRPISIAIRTLAEEVYSSENAKFIYDALHVFGCVEFFGETYACAIRMDAEQRSRTLAPSTSGGSSSSTQEPEIQAPVIERYDEKGELLKTQQLRSATNWRSATRMRLFLRNNGPAVTTYLFHTRFCFDPTDLIGTAGATQAEKKIVARCSSIAAIAEVAKARAAKNQDACLILGDFNIPEYSPDKFTAARDAWTAATAGLTELPDPQPARKRTTLRSPASFLYEIGEAGANAQNVSFGSEPYDRALFAGTTVACTCVPLPVPTILPQLTGEQFFASVTKYYRRCIEKIIAVLGRLHEYIESASTRRAWGKTAFDDELFGKQIKVRQVLDSLIQPLANAAAPADLPKAATLEPFVSLLKNAKLPQTFQRNVDAFADDIDYLIKQMKALESSEPARLHLAYVSLVSDHLPLLVEITPK